MKCRIIAISNRKGGTGKTTTAVNLAAGLAIFIKKRVLLVDVDAQSSATLSCGFLPNNPTFSVFGVLNNNIKIYEAILKTKIENLFILPSYIKLSTLETNLIMNKNGEYLLKKNLDLISDKFDFILIDCPPKIDIMGLSALIASNEVIIPIRLDFLSIEGANQMLNILQKVVETRNKYLNVDGILITHFDEANSKSMDYFGTITMKKFSTVIHFDLSLAEAPKYSRPIFLYKPDSIGAKDYEKLTYEVYELY